MIGLDSNVLIRYVTQDEPAMAARAGRLIEGQLRADSPGYVSLLVVAEMAWVLQRSYHLRPAAVAATLRRLLQIEVLVVQSEAEVYLALEAVEQGQGGFADALISALARRAGCSTTLTLDREALRLPGFTAL